MSDQAQWLRDRISFHAIRLGILDTMDVDAKVQCPVCASSDSRGRELCGCGGHCTVAEAIAFHQSELSMLSAPMQPPVGMEAKP